MTTVFLTGIGIVLYLVIDKFFKEKPKPNTKPKAPLNRCVEPLAGILKMAFLVMLSWRLKRFRVPQDQAAC